TLTFLPGETTKALPLSIFGDFDIEPDETVRLQLQNFQIGIDGVDAVLADDPVALWRMNETGGAVIVDSAPAEGAQNGAFAGAPVFGEPGADPNIGRAVRFNPGDGSNDYATISNVPISDSFSVELWARSATPTWNTSGWLAVERGANGFIMHPDQGGTLWRGFVNDSGGTFHQIGGHTVGAADITQWHHYALSYDAGTDTGVMYFDGQAVATATNLLGAASRSTNGNITIELGRDDLAGRFGDGWLDEVAVFNASLTPAQRQSHFDAGTGLRLPVGQAGTTQPQSTLTIENDDFPPNVPARLQNLAVTNMVNEGDAVSLTGRIVDPNPGDTFELTVEWGDGTRETVAFPAGTTDFEVQHVYIDDNPTATPQDDVSIRVFLTDNRDMGQWDARLVQVTGNAIDNTNEAINIEAFATSTGALTAGGQNYNVTILAEEFNDVINYAGGAGNFNAGNGNPDNPYPGGSATPGNGNDFLVRAHGLFTVPAGTYTIAFGSDDGGLLRIPGITFDSVFNTAGGLGAGTDTVRFDAPRGHAATGGTFTLTEETTLDVFSFFWERGGGDSFEISVAPGAQGGFNGAFQLLTDGTAGWTQLAIDSANLVVTVKNVDPDPGTPVGTTTPAAPITIDLNDFVIDPGLTDVHTFTPATITTPLGATVTILANGQATYDPNGRFGGLLPGQEITEAFVFSLVDDDTGSATGTARITVRNNTPQPVYDYSLEEFTVVEGNSAHTTRVVRVNRSGVTNIASSVLVELSPGAVDPATPGVDLESGPIRVDFLPGETFRLVPIQIFGDLDEEANETLQLSFSAPVSVLVDFNEVDGAGALVNGSAVEPGAIPFHVEQETI
ncbi:MAG: hypothetical protein KDA42_19480, partial [Planctomycetales bacterium]|nr:hypothetical protein [Planctomycetales bacterium]